MPIHRLCRHGWRGYGCGRNLLRALRQKHRIAAFKHRHCRARRCGLRVRGGRLSRNRGRQSRGHQPWRGQSGQSGRQMGGKAGAEIGCKIRPQSTLRPCRGIRQNRSRHGQRGGRRGTWHRCRLHRPPLWHRPLSPERRGHRLRPTLNRAEMLGNLGGGGAAQQGEKSTGAAAHPLSLHDAVRTAASRCASPASRVFRPPSGKAIKRRTKAAASSRRPSARASSAM